MQSKRDVVIYRTTKEKSPTLSPLGSEQNVQQSDICSPMWSLGVKVVAMRGKPEKG
jgi:hypothetical protein